MSSRAATKTATDAHGAGFSFRIELGSFIVLPIKELLSREIVWGDELFDY